MRHVLAWSRILSDTEVVIALNTDNAPSGPLHVVVDSRLNARVAQYTCKWSTESAQIGSSAPASSVSSGARVITIRVPPNGLTVWGT
jgi:hypothetical protein